jgi:hypothetical protein
MSYVSLPCVIQLQFHDIKLTELPTEIIQKYRKTSTNIYLFVTERQI